MEEIKKKIRRVKCTQSKTLSVKPSPAGSKCAQVHGDKMVSYVR